MPRFKYFLVFVLVLAFAQLGFAGGNEKDIILEVDSGIGYFTPPTVVYKYAINDSAYDIDTGSGAMWTVGLKAGYTLKGVGWAKDSLFGDAPVVELAYRYDDYDEKEDNIFRPGVIGPAGIYGGGGGWPTGSWDYKQDISNNAFRLGLWGSDSEGDGFVPYIGIGYQRYAQDWQARRQQATIFISKLEAGYYGVSVGGDYRVERKNGWQLIITPMVFVHYVQADLNFQQDPDNTVGIINVDDNMSTSFGSYGAALDLSVKKYFADTFFLGLTGGAVYNNRTPYGRPPTTQPGRAQIAAESSYIIRGTLDIGVEF